MEAQPVAVVAMGRNGVIGQGGAMPWRLPSDLRRYRRLTMGKPMIMGRRTLESIGRVLDGRDSVVLSRSATLSLEGAHRAGSPEEALLLGERLAAARGAREIVVAGGGEIYGLFMDRVRRLYVTHVEAAPDGDARFPPIEPGLWRLVSQEPPAFAPGDSAASRFAVYERR